MSTSDRRRGRDGQHRNQSMGLSSLSSLSRYDIILALIPVAFVLTVTAAVVLDLPLHTAVTGASLVGAIGIADALFLNPPGQRR